MYCTKAKEIMRQILFNIVQRTRPIRYFAKKEECQTSQTRTRDRKPIRGSVLPINFPYLCVHSEGKVMLQSSESFVMLC